MGAFYLSLFIWYHGEQRIKAEDCNSKYSECTGTVGTPGAFTGLLG